MEIILDNIPVGIFLLDEKRNIVYRNKTAAEMGGEKLLDMMKDFSAVYKMAGRFYRGKKISIEGGSIVVVEDVTERVMAENALKESENRYRALSENSFMGIAVFNGKKITYINKRMEEIVGYDKKYLKKKFFEIIHPDDMEKLSGIMNGSPNQIRIFDKQGNVRWLEAACADMGNDFKMLNMIDITKRKEMEDKLKDANERMKRVLEKEKKFLEEVSHYFFNPLCIAKGYLELSIPNADPSLRKKLETTKQAVIRVENVVKHIVMEGKIYE